MKALIIIGLIAMIYTVIFALCKTASDADKQAEIEIENNMKEKYEIHTRN